MGALIYPSNVFSNFVQNMDDLFCALFGGIMYQKDVLKTLCEHASSEIPQLIKCGNVHCTIRLHEYVKLYMTIRIHHAIKMSNIGMSSGHKEIEKCSSYVISKMTSNSHCNRLTCVKFIHAQINNYLSCIYNLYEHIKSF